MISAGKRWRNLGSGASFILPIWLLSNRLSGPLLPLQRHLLYFPALKRALSRHRRWTAVLLPRTLARRSVAFLIATPVVNAKGGSDENLDDSDRLPGR